MAARIRRFISAIFIILSVVLVVMEQYAGAVGLVFLAFIIYFSPAQTSRSKSSGGAEAFTSYDSCNSGSSDGGGSDGGAV